MILFKYPKGLVTPVFYLLKVFYTSYLVFKVINWVYTILVEVRTARRYSHDHSITSEVLSLVCPSLRV